MFNNSIKSNRMNMKRTIEYVYKSYDVTFCGGNITCHTQLTVNTS